MLHDKEKQGRLLVVLALVSMFGIFRGIIAYEISLEVGKGYQFEIHGQIID